MLVRSATIVAIATFAGVFCVQRAAASSADPFVRLTHEVRSIAANLPALSGVDIVDLSTGYRAGFNAAASMPAASTIKIPVMVEVFAQLAAGRFDLDRRVTLLASDKDWGSGDLCDAPVGSTYTVSQLLVKMIDISDNTATNMLIRLVGRRNINREMGDLGLRHTHLADDVRTDEWSIRQQLRTSPADLARLLALMARRELVDEWSSNEMVSILARDEINTLLPEPLPENVVVAHKTGSLDDTMNDAGIVYAEDAPYVIAVMTTALPSQDLGRSFIRAVSRIAYTSELQFAQWRAATGLEAPFALGGAASPGPRSPDVRYWSAAPASDDVTTGGL
ncbi:MAG TPA: serine hydrolase [Candidatus Acidoferrales bacterium]|nr:serine hydrolase [Candidatus Acidoferrales bacterium]